MIIIDAPGWGRREIEHVVMDFNGTLATDGRLLPGVDQRLPMLSIRARIHLCTSDFYGTVTSETSRFELALKILKGTNQNQQKAELVRRLGPLKVVTIGGGNNDAHMLREATVGIAVIGPEGASSTTVAAADVICLNINDALDLLLNPERLAATLQK